MVNEEKKRIRNTIRALKAQVSVEEKRARSEKIMNSLEEHPFFRQAETVMLYWSMEDEVYTRDFVCRWAVEKRIILPCVDGESLLLKEFEGVDMLVPGDNFGIPEPNGPEFTNIMDIDLVVVPGVAFDINSNRMGRGKAYYDKLLKSVAAVKIGVCFDFQLLEQVPVDEHDVKMEMVIGESSIVDNYVRKQR